MFKPIHPLNDGPAQALTDDEQEAEGREALEEERAIQKAFGENDVPDGYRLLDGHLVTSDAYDEYQRELDDARALVEAYK